tara:strand:- start:226 stop:492 length:267 start_codon:yes stop_codon:yes gene_type:complete
MKISKSNISKMILQELNELTKDMMINQASDDLKDKLLKGFTHDELSELSPYEIERLVDELITDKFLLNIGLTNASEEKILSSTLKKLN